MRPPPSPACRPRTARGLLAAGAALFAALAWPALAPGAAGAATVSFAFQGVVTDVSGDNGFFGPPGSVQAGDAFSGHFAYETGTTNPDQLPGDPEVGVYDVLSFAIDQAVVPLTPVGIEITHEPGGITIPPAPPDPGLDRVRVVATAPGYSVVQLDLVADFGAVFGDDSLPTFLALSDFPQATVAAIVSFGVPPQPAILDAGTLTSLTPVPEPGAAALLGAGALAALGARARGTSPRGR